MKRIKKLVVWMLCTVFLLFTLSGCGAEQEQTGMPVDDYEEISQAAESFLDLIVNLEPEEKDGMLEYFEYSYGQEFSDGLEQSIEAYESVAGELGGFVEFGETKGEMTDDGFILTAICSFEKRDCEVVAQMNDTSLVFSFNPVYTMGENMAKAGMNTLMGMGTVFAVLIFISLIIYCFKYISAAEKRLKAKKVPDQPAPAPEAPPAEEAGETVDDLEVVAVITAAVAAYAAAEGSDGLVVRSIRRLPGSKWKRA